MSQTSGEFKTLLQLRRKITRAIIKLTPEVGRLYARQIEDGGWRMLLTVEQKVAITSALAVLGVSQKTVAAGIAYQASALSDALRDKGSRAFPDEKLRALLDRIDDLARNKLNNLETDVLRGSSPSATSADRSRAAYAKMEKGAVAMYMAEIARIRTDLFGSSLRQVVPGALLTPEQVRITRGGHLHSCEQALTRPHGNVLAIIAGAGIGGSSMLEAALEGSGALRQRTVVQLEPLPMEEFDGLVPADGSDDFGPILDRIVRGYAEAIVPGAQRTDLAGLAGKALRHQVQNDIVRFAKSQRGPNCRGLIVVINSLEAMADAVELISGIDRQRAFLGRFVQDFGVVLIGAVMKDLRRTGEMMIALRCAPSAPIEGVRTSNSALSNVLTQTDRQDLSGLQGPSLLAFMDAFGALDGTSGDFNEAATRNPFIAHVFYRLRGHGLVAAEIDDFFRVMLSDEAVDLPDRDQALVQGWAATIPDFRAIRQGLRQWRAKLMDHWRWFKLWSDLDAVRLSEQVSAWRRYIREDGALESQFEAGRFANWLASEGLLPHGSPVESVLRHLPILQDNGSVSS